MTALEVMDVMETSMREYGDIDVAPHEDEILTCLFVVIAEAIAAATEPKEKTIFERVKELKTP